MLQDLMARVTEKAHKETEHEREETLKETE